MLPAVPPSSFVGHWSGELITSSKTRNVLSLTCVEGFNLNDTFHDVGRMQKVDGFERP